MKRNLPPPIDTTPLVPFATQFDAAVAAYDRYIVCIAKPPDEFAASMVSLGLKALNAYETRPAGSRHGIACDKNVTIIFSHQEDAAPLCGIYFNLHSPYKKPTAKPELGRPERQSEPDVGQVPPPEK